jgi:hypothetical protein
VANELAQPSVEVGQLAVEVRNPARGTGTLAGEKLGGHGANGVQVLAGVGIDTGQLFGSEIPRRAEDRAVTRHPRFVEQPGDAEVRQPQMRPAGPGDVEQEVRRFHIAVDDACRMHRGQTVQQLIQQNYDVRRRQRTVITEERRDRPAPHQIHRENDLVVVRGPPVGRHHVRVLDPQRLLPHEPQQGRRVMLPEHLRRHVRRSPHIPRPPD